MFLDAAILVVIAAARWHQLRHHDQQVAAAHQTLIHLQAAYEHTAVAPLTALAQRRPPQQVVQRHILLIHQIMPDHAKQVAEDPSFDALTAALAAAEGAGHDPKKLLQQATDERALDDARSPARVLTWRVERLSARPVPSERARVARIRSATRWSVGPVRPTTVASASQPQPPQARRRLLHPLRVGHTPIRTPSRCQAAHPSASWANARARNRAPTASGPRKANARRALTCRPEAHRPVAGERNGTTATPSSVKGAWSR